MGITQANGLKMGIPNTKLFTTQGKREDNHSTYLLSTYHMPGTVPSVEDTTPKSSVVPATVERILWKGRQTKTCREITGAVPLVGETSKGCEREQA